MSGPRTMVRGAFAIVLASALVAVAACGADRPSASSDLASGVAEMAPAQAGAMGKSAGEAFLAYEHDVSVSLAAESIEARLAATREACTSSRFGACVVLDVHQQGGDHASASIGMRIEPAGVEPMIGLASEGAELGTRSTRAEDLAVVVRDNAQARERLAKELARLHEFQARRDLAVADMIALSERLAATEAQLEAVERDAAQHQRRIRTQRLTVRFSATRGQEAQGEITRALRDFGGILATGTAWTIRATAFLLPVLLVVLVLVAILRRWRRRRQRQQPS